MNVDRATAGLLPVTLSAPVTAVAHAHACDLTLRHDIGHTGADGASLSDQLRQGGITALMVAENTASFFKTHQAAMQAWMASPYHRENMQRPQVRAVGIGQADGTKALWVVDFTS